MLHWYTILIGGWWGVALIIQGGGWGLRKIELYGWWDLEKKGALGYHTTVSGIALRYFSGGMTELVLPKCTKVLNINKYFRKQKRDSILSDKIYSQYDYILKLTRNIKKPQIAKFQDRLKVEMLKE